MRGIRQHKGFTLIEILVGLAIGMVATLAIFQSLSLFEAQRRTTGSGADMQQNGLISLFTIEQDIRQGGYGLIDSATSQMPCVTINSYQSGQNSVMNSAPVSIIDGGAGLSDTITVSRFDSDAGGIVTGGRAAKLAANTSGGVPTSITVDTAKSFAPGDFLLLAASGVCSLLKIDPAWTLPTTSASLSNASVSLVTAPNPAGDTTLTPAAAPAYSIGASVVDLGLPQSGQTTPAFSSISYSVDSNYNLVQSTNRGSGVSIASNIVNVQAQYGTTTSGSGVINCWTDATGSSCSPASGSWASPSASDIARIKAIRVAIVARSAQKEMKQGGACVTTTNVPTSWPGGPVIDISGIADWQCYRYKVYSTIIPVRNVIWGNI